MDVLFLAFANRNDNPLPTLREEDEGVYAALSRRTAENHFVPHRLSFATLPQVAEYLIRFREQICLFLYSGHAGQSILALEDGNANAAGIAQLLGQCPRLKLVVLNGCSTDKQVATLLEKGVPVVIGTSAPVGDRSAAQFSISFFQALARQNCSIREAFEVAIGAAQAASSNTLAVEKNRGLALRSEATEKPLWGYFYQEGGESDLDWKLPAALEKLSTAPFEPNERLIEALMKALAPFNAAIADILENEEMGGEASDSDKHKIILESLPHPISEQLRKLLAPKDDNSQHVFFDKPGLDRLRQIAATFNTLIEFLGFIMLGQLWDALNERKNLNVPPEHLTILKSFFLLKHGDRKAFNFIPLIRSVRLIFDENEIPYFIGEMNSLQQIFNSQSDFFHACQYMETLKKNLEKNEFSDREAWDLSMQAEDKLADIFLEMGFLDRYTLASVKDIDVLKYRHLKELKYKHKLVSLVQKFVKLAEEKKILKTLLDTSSVLLLKKGDNSFAYLNLSPFIIDENAFDEKAADVSKLHFFDRYERDTYYFRHVYKPNDRLLEVQKQKEYLVLREQFDVFANLLFHQPMNAL